MLFFRRKKYQKLEDTELLQLYCKGNDKAVEELYTRFTRELILFIFKYTRDESVAEDIVSAQFIKLLEYSFEERNKKFQNIRNAKAFLYTMVKNASLDYIKTQKNRAEIVQGLPEYLEFKVEPKAIILLEHQELYSIIETLSTKQKEYLLLQLRGYKPSDIMKQTGAKSISTVKNTLQQAKKNLKERMGHEI